MTYQSEQQLERALIDQKGTPRQLREYSEQKAEKIRIAKDFWWKGFGILTAIALSQATISHAGYPGIFSWIAIVLLFTTIVFYFYRKSLKDIHYLRELGLEQQKTWDDNTKRIKQREKDALDKEARKWSRKNQEELSRLKSLKKRSRR